MYHLSSGRTSNGRIICSGINTHDHGVDELGRQFACGDTNSYYAAHTPPHAPGVIDCQHNELVAARRDNDRSKSAAATARLEAAERSRTTAASRVPEAVEAAFECSICAETCVDPATTPCGHNFCSDHLR